MPLIITTMLAGGIQALVRLPMLQRQRDLAAMTRVVDDGDRLLGAVSVPDDGMAHLDIAPDLPPAVAGFLFHGRRLRAEHALALIVSLEEKGHLASVPRENGEGGDWLFVERHSEVPLTPAERALRRGMFGLNSETDLVWLGRFLTKSRVRRIERALLSEAGRYGLVIKLWLWYPIMAVFGVALVAALCTGPIIDEFTSRNLTDLELVSAAVLPVVLVSLFKPAQRTPYGDHVHDLLASRRRNPQGLEPVMGIALGLPDETVRTLNAKVPNLSPYLRDHRYRRRWNRTVDHRIRASRRSGGGGGGGRTSGRGGGGGGGGRR